MKKSRLLEMFALFVLASPALSQVNSDINHTLSMASYFSSGDYGESLETNILYFPLSYSIARGQWRAEATAAHLAVDGVGNVLVNVGGVSRAVAGTERARNRGVGDVNLALVYEMEPISAKNLFIDLRLDIKIPTAEHERGLGTGEADYSVQIDLSRNLGSSVIFSSIGYTFRGKTDLYAGLRDSASMQLGVARPVSERWNIGVFYDFREPASTFAEEVHEIVPYINWQINSSWSLTGLAAFGFTDASADAALLGQLSFRW